MILSRQKGKKEEEDQEEESGRRKGGEKKGRWRCIKGREERTEKEN